MKKLPLRFYRQPCLELAPALLGKLLVRSYAGNRLVCRITETEAYLGVSDRACHTFGGRRTQRTEAMYGPPGHAYVYLIYGMYDCLNVVAEKEGNPCAVLIRAAEPVAGWDEMAQLRYRRPWGELTRSQQRHLADGPGKLCRAMGITREQNGLSLTGRELYLAEEVGAPLPDFETAPRVKVDYAGEDALRPWRFLLKRI